MSVYSPHQYVEIFHLIFLRYLETTVDKSLYALKGGCNLRFFMKSIRYSEDMDLDVRTVARGTLTKNVNKLLSAPGLRATLQARGIQIAEHSAPKQTDTTQRWKIRLKVSHRAVPLPTKIEFSRRGLAAGVEHGPVDPELIRRYQLYQILCSHYSKHAACQQKLAALLGRPATQARDVFDLHLLLEHGADLSPAAHPSRPRWNTTQWNTIEATIGEIDHAAFQAQVVAYLLPTHQDYYRSPQVWNDIRTRVVAAIRTWR